MLMLDCVECERQQRTTVRRCDLLAALPWLRMLSQSVLTIHTITGRYWTSWPAPAVYWSVLTDPPSEAPHWASTELM